MKYNLLCFQISGRFIIFFNKHDYQVSASLMKQNKRYKRLKTAKWISIRKLVPGLLTVRSAGLGVRAMSVLSCFTKSVQMHYSYPFLERLFGIQRCSSFSRSTTYYKDHIVFSDRFPFSLDFPANIQVNRNIGSYSRRTILSNVWLCNLRKKTCRLEKTDTNVKTIGYLSSFSGEDLAFVNMPYLDNGKTGYWLKDNNTTHQKN